MQAWFRLLPQTLARLVPDTDLNRHHVEESLVVQTSGKAHSGGPLYHTIQLLAKRTLFTGMYLIPDLLSLKCETQLTLTRQVFVSAMDGSSPTRVKLGAGSTRRLDKLVKLVTLDTLVTFDTLDTLMGDINTLD